MNQDKTHQMSCRKSCYAVAAQRARLTRMERRSNLFFLLTFLWAIISSPFRSRRSQDQAHSEEWPITEYERGAVGPFPRRQASSNARYSARTSLSTLVADLRRPAARDAAYRALLERVIDPVTRAWVADRFANDDIIRLSVWAREGRREDWILAAWRHEANVAMDEAAAEIGVPHLDRASMRQLARLLDEMAGAETESASGPKPPGAV